MTVPLSDEVARRVPVELIERNEIGDLCAWMTLATVSERVEKRSTSPDCGAALDDEEGTEFIAEVPGVAGDGTGEGYAR